MSEEGVILLKLLPADDSAELEIRATTKTKVSRLAEAYGGSKNVEASAFRLFLGPHRLNPEQTLGELTDLLQEYNYEICVMTAQQGGM
jgi:hypothetical protein